MSDSFSCPACGKKYRLTGRAPASFACRACGAAIALPRTRPAVATDDEADLGGETDEREEGDGPGPAARAAGEVAASCPKCGATVAAGARFCDGCGKALGGSSRRNRLRDDPMLRRHASRELGKATRFISAVRGLCITYAVFQAITLAFLLLARSETVHRWGSSPPELDALVAGSGAMFVLLLSAIFFLRRQPFLWTVVLAGLQTLYLAAALMWGEGKLTLAITIVNTLGLWAAVGVTSRISSLLREFPDLRVALKMTGGANAGRPRGMGSRYADEAKADRRRILKRVAMVGGGIVVVIVALVVLRSKPTEPTPPPPPPPAPGLQAALARFSDDWRSSKLAVLRASMMDDQRARSWERIVEKRGWKQGLPPIGAPERFSQEGDEGFAAFPLKEEGAGEIRVQFTYQDRRWLVRSIVFPRE